MSASVMPARRAGTARTALVAALAGAGAVLMTAPVAMTPALAQFKPDAMARAPLSFADIVEKVKPTALRVKRDKDGKISGVEPQEE